MTLFGLHWLGGLIFDEWVTNLKNKRSKTKPETDIFVDFQQTSNGHINVVINSSWRNITIGPFKTFNQANDEAIKCTKKVIMAHPKMMK